MSSHHSHRSSYDGYPRRSVESVRTSQHTSARYGQPVTYASTTRPRSSSVNGHSRHSPTQYYTVSDAGRVGRGRSLERASYVPAQQYQGYGYAATPSTTAYSHRRSGSHHSRHSPTATTVYAAPATGVSSSSRHSRSHSRTRGRSGSQSSFIDARHSHYPSVRVIPDSDPDRAYRRSRSVSVERGDGHVSFGDRVRRLFGLAPAEEHTSRRNVYYANPRTGREITPSGKAYRSRRMEFIDARTGREVDRNGRPIYTV